MKNTIYSGFSVLIGQALENIGSERFPAELSNNYYLCQGFNVEIATVARRRVRILKSQYYVSLADLVFTFNIKHKYVGVEFPSSINLSVSGGFAPDLVTAQQLLSS